MRRCRRSGCCGICGSDTRGGGGAVQREGAKRHSAAEARPKPGAESLEPRVRKILAKMRDWDVQQCKGSRRGGRGSVAGCSGEFQSRLARNGDMPGQRRPAVKHQDMTPSELFPSELFDGHPFFNSQTFTSSQRSSNSSDPDFGHWTRVIVIGPHLFTGEVMFKEDRCVRNSSIGISHRNRYCHQILS